MSIALGKRAFEVASRYMLREFAVSYNFLSMSSTFKSMGLFNCADWCIKKSEENRSRAMEVFHHIEDRGVKLKLAPIPISRQDWRAPLHIFEEVYRQEQELSGLISVIYESAVADKDYVMQQFITGFFEKHSKSENNSLNLLNRLRKMQSSDIGVFEFDAELSSAL